MKEVEKQRSRHNPGADSEVIVCSSSCVDALDAHLIEVSKIGVSVLVLWERSISARGVGRIIQCRRTSMTRSAASCSVRATFLIIILSLLLSVDALCRYRGVSKRKDTGLYHCEVTFLGTSPREKVWVGTYPTEELAALACDVVFYYTNRPSDEFNLEYSEEAIQLNCKARSAYENLHNWDERRIFIKAEAKRLISLLSTADQAPELRWEDVAEPPSVSLHRIAGEIAGTIVEHFRNQAERIQEFLAWLIQLSDPESGLPLPAQQREAPVFQGLPLVADRILDLHDVTLLLESLASPGRSTLWLAFIAGSLQMLFQMFNAHTTNTAAGDVEDPNDAKLADQITWPTATKRQKVAIPSIQLVSDRVSGVLTAITFEVTKGLQCTGYDLLSKTWKTLPPFSYLRDLYLHNYSVCGHGGLMCALVSKGELVVFNPLTSKNRTLPPLLHQRNPVLMHMLVDSATKSYKVIVAGSSSLKDEHLSKKMEVFDSRTSKWEEMCDLPGPAFGLNEYQTGVCVNGILYFMSFLEGDDCRKGVIAFDVENRQWLPSMTCPLPCKSTSGNVQLVENDGEVYLFYEDEGCFEQRIDVLEVSEPSSEAVTCQWRNVVQVWTGGERGLRVYPEITCVGFGEGKLCIFNTITAAGVVYDMGSGRVIDILEPPVKQPRSEPYYSLNPASFIVQLSSGIDPTPPSNDAT